MTCFTNPYGEKYLKFIKNKLSAVVGANIASQICFCDLKVPYEHVYYNQFTLDPSTNDFVLNYGNIGDLVTVVALRVTYNTVLTEPEKYIIYKLYDGTELHNLSEMMILSGTSEHRIPRLLLSNPNPSYSVKVEVFASTLDIVFDTTTPPVTSESTVYENLTENSIQSQSVNVIKILTDPNTVNEELLTYINLTNISSTELNGNVVIIDDISAGRLFLIYDNSTNALTDYTFLQSLT